MKGSWNQIHLIPIITLYFLLFFIFDIEDVFAAPAKHLCHPEHRDAILKFKNEFEIHEPCFDMYPLKTESWANNSDCCYWDGVTCDDKLGEVIKLDLSGSCLRGQLKNLQNLRFLTTLNLSRNDFSGQIPFSLGYLSNLTTIDLSSNRFNGSIPSWIRNISKLTSLDFSHNNLDGEIPSLIGNLSQLTTLHLSHNNFVGKIPSSLGNLLHLTSLDLSYNNFFGEIPTSLGNLSKLTNLVLSNNNFIGEIPVSFGSLNELASLHGSSNRFSGRLPSSLFSIPSLETISLEYNQLSGTLEFGNISSSSKLIKLGLGNNKFRGPIPTSISKLVNLEELDLSHLNTQGSVDFSIFSPLKSLQKFHVSHLNTTTVIDLNAILSCFKSLDTLDLSGNHVSTTSKSSVSNAPLVLSELYLSGCGITEFPGILITPPTLTLLDISNNKMEGQVPGWLWMLPVLQYVNLSNNTFIGFQRSTKRVLSSVSEPAVRQLFGSYNNFTGNLPSFLCRLPFLSTLDLSNNKFNGSIPRCMGFLQALNLRRNRLSGRLPEHIYGSLRSLDVGHNQLVGKLPKSLILSSFLTFMNVESNKINDTFPFWLSSLQKLQVIVLRSNAFHGPIQLTRFTKLRIIDISHNHFNGTLPPDCFVNWTTMFSIGKNEDESVGRNEDQPNKEIMRLAKKKYMGSDYYYFDCMVLVNKGISMELVRIPNIYTALDFSGNNFEGEIPRSIGLLKELHVLNLSNNAFTGHIPSSMGNLRSLESLDVSKNKLTGEIPQELGNLSYLAYMNFSHNQLVGLVPGGTQFRRQPCSSFENNPGLYGPSLEEVCVDIYGKESQQSEKPGAEEDKEEVMSWIAAAVGFIPGVVFGLTVGYILASYYKSEWFMKPSGRNKRRSISTTFR